MPQRTIIFDFDGTLADTMPELVDTLVESFGSHLKGHGGPPRQQITDLLELPPAEVMRALSGLTGWSPSRVQSVLGPATARLPARLFPEVTDVLDSLKHANYVIVVSSNTPDNAFPGRLQAAGIADRCDLALGTNLQAGITKADHPRVAAERAGLSAEAFAATGVFVADLPSDMQLARRAGLLAIGRLTGSNGASLMAAGAHRVIVDLTELIALLNQPERTGD